jgi:hypothetical protein
MAGDQVDDDQVDGQESAGDEPADEGRPARVSGGGSGRAAGGSDGANWVLGLLLWAGVVLPFIQGGPAGVKAWWLAKFLNKAPDGSWLP